jgi:hypothetical protein
MSKRIYAFGADVGNQVNQFPVDVTILDKVSVWIPALDFIPVINITTAPPDVNTPPFLQQINGPTNGFNFTVMTFPALGDDLASLSAVKYQLQVPYGWDLGAIEVSPIVTTPDAAAVDPAVFQFRLTPIALGVSLDNETGTEVAFLSPAMTLGLCYPIAPALMIPDGLVPASNDVINLFIRRGDIAEQIVSLVGVRLTFTLI